MNILANFSFVLLAVVVVFIFLSVKQVPQGYEWTVERFGKYVRTLKPGLHIIIPFVERISAKMSMKEQVLDIPSQVVISRDNAQVKVDGVAFFQVVNCAKAVYEVDNLIYALRNLVMTNIRTVLGSIEVDEQLSNRDEINRRLLGVIDEAVTPWGIKINRIEIKDISPPENLINAMSQQMEAERKRRAAILTAEGVKKSEILRAEGDKQAVILRAEAEKEKQFREAEARERTAQAEAKATKVVSEAISQGNINAIQYFVADKYIDALGKIVSADNQKVVLLPFEATQLLGSLGGIQSLLEKTNLMNVDKG